METSPDLASGPTLLSVAHRIPRTELRGWRALTAAVAAAVLSTAFNLSLETIVDRALLLGPYLPVLFALTLAAGRPAGRWFILLNSPVACFVFLRSAEPAMFILSSLAMVSLGVLTHVSAAALRTAFNELRERETALAAAHSDLSIIARELDHRVKNLLTVVQSVAAHTAQGSTDLGEFRAAFNDRLHALARAQTALVNGAWQQVDLEELVRSVLRPFESPIPGAGLLIEAGPDMRLSSDLAIALGLALHELATNASKHGALRPDGGTTICRWSETNHETIQLVWSEHNQAAVQPHEGAGFGTQLIGRLLKRFGQVHVSLNRDGLQFAVEFPRASIDRTKSNHSDLSGVAPLSLQPSTRLSA